MLSQDTALARLEKEALAETLALSETNAVLTFRHAITDELVLHWDRFKKECWYEDADCYVFLGHARMPWEALEQAKGQFEARWPKAK